MEGERRTLSVSSLKATVSSNNNQNASRLLMFSAFANSQQVTPHTVADKCTHKCMCTYGHVNYLSM